MGKDRSFAVQPVLSSCGHAERLWHDGARLLVPGQLPIVNCRAAGAVGGGQLACSVQPGAEVPCHLHR